MAERQFNVLFLCTHNSARSIIAEAITNKFGKAKLHGYSAGSHPGGRVHPYAIELLTGLGYDTRGLRSKSWDEFGRLDAPQMDFIFTVCDEAANEVCPVWPGQPMTAHWGLADPSRVEGTEAQKRFAFANAHRLLRHRIDLFLNLPVASLERLALQKKLDDIGRSTHTPEKA